MYHRSIIFTRWCASSQHVSPQHYLHEIRIQHTADALNIWIRLNAMYQLIGICHHADKRAMNSWYTVSSGDWWHVNVIVMVTCPVSTTRSALIASPRELECYAEIHGSSKVSSFKNFSQCRRAIDSVEAIDRWERHSSVPRQKTADNWFVLPSWRWTGIKYATQKMSTHGPDICAS